MKKGTELKRKSRNYDEDYRDYREHGGYKGERRFYGKSDNKKRYQKKKLPFIVEVELVDPTADVDTENSEKINPHVPSYETPGAAGADLKAFLKEDVVIEPQSRAVIDTNVKFKIPYGFYGEIQSRSGIGSRNGIGVLTGTIDADYRGQVKVVLINTDKTESFRVKNLDRIAQIVFMPVKHARFSNVEQLSEDANNQRGENGFGSTGVNNSEEE